MAADPNFDSADLKSSAKLADLPLPAERTESIVKAAAPIHQLLRSLADVDYAQTPPASAYSAQWR